MSTKRHSTEDVARAVIEIRELAQTCKRGIGSVMALEEHIQALEEALDKRDDMLKRFVDAHLNSATPSTRVSLLEDAQRLLATSVPHVETPGGSVPTFKR